MTVQSQISKKIYAGDGTTKIFATVFGFINQEDVKVILVASDETQTLLTLSSDYTLSGGAGASGSVIMVTAPASGEQLIIYRDPPITQETDYINNDPFNAETNELALDKITHILQRQKEILDRSLTLPENSAITNALPSAQAGYLLAWNEAETALVNIANTASSELVTTVGTTTGRSLANRFADIINVKDFGAVGNGTTDDTLAVQSATALAYADGKELFFPAGTYLTSASIPNFHDVKHLGNAIVKRGSDLYYINPKNENQINNLYVATTGDNANDGLSASEPLLTPQKGADILNNKGDFVQGSWRISIADGTYSRIRFDDQGVKFATPIIIAATTPRNLSSGNVWLEMGSPSGTLSNPGVISGTYTIGETVTGSISGFTGTLVLDGNARITVTITSGTPQIDDIVTGATSGASAKILLQAPVPRVIIKEGATQAAFGIRGFDLTDLTVQDILVEDFNGSTASAGVYVSNRANLRLINVHIVDCYSGVAGLEWCEIDVKGGVIYDCGYLNSVTAGGYAIRGLFHSKFSVGTQNAGSLVDAPIIRECYFGLFGQEHCTGHSDYVFYRFNEAAIRLTTMSRINCDGSRFYDNGNAIWATDNAIIAPSGNTILGTGSSANTNNYLIGGGANISSFGGIDNKIPAYFTSSRCIDRVYANQTVQTTSATVIDSINLIAPYFAAVDATGIPIKGFKYRVWGTCNGLTSNKRLTHRFGGTNIGSLVFTASEQGDFYAEGSLNLIGGGTSQYGHIWGSIHLGANRQANVISGINLNTTDAVYQLEAQVDNVADSIVIHVYEIIAEG